MAWARSHYPRIYQLIRQKGRITDVTFEIEILDPGIGAFSLTFGLQNIRGNQGIQSLSKQLPSASLDRKMVPLLDARIIQNSPDSVNVYKERTWQLPFWSPARPAALAG